MTKSTMSYFTGSFLFTIICMVIGFAYGMYTTNSVQNSISMMTIIAILGVLEVSLSFDNAIVNATVLRDMSPKWQHRFVTWGMIIAVFGMRIVFPVLIVSIVGQIGFFEAINISFTNPEKYAAILHSSHIQVAGFGGAFLLLVALNFFFNEEKDVHWIHSVEKQLVKLGAKKSSEILATILIMISFSYMLNHTEQLSFIVSSLFGILVHEAVKGFGDYMESKQEERSHLTTTVAKNGFASFMYLEVLDASFSFDGVIGAFAITNSIVIIALGLGIGAMFVRSLTIMFVEKNTLEQFKYLEHGAFWSILTLAMIMFVSTKHEIPEVVTGLLAAITIICSLVWSIIKKDKEVEE